MIIECPYCTTRFRLDERSLGASRPTTLRCSQCRRTFAPPPRADPDADDDDLSFEYDDDSESVADAEDTDTTEDEVSLEPPRGRSRAEQLILPSSRRSPRDDSQHSLFGDDDEDDDYSIGDSAARDAQFEQDFIGGDEDDEYFDDGESDVSQPVQIRPLLVFVALVVVGYAALTWTLRTNPDWARNLMQQMPVLGSEVDANRLGRAVVLEDLRGRYERTKEGKLIFVVTGNARNDHDEPLRGIRVELQLVDVNGSPVAKQATTCGNAMRPDLVRDLTEEQVAILRGWGTKPPVDTNVNPGASCPIVSIFLDVPANVAEFSGEVVQARRLS